MGSVEIPNDLLIKIVKLVAADRWWLLSVLIRSGKKLKNIVYLMEILEITPIFSLYSDPEDIMIGGRHRPFFQRCLNAGNAIAYYYQGLRLVAKEWDIEGAIEMISRNVPADGDSTFTADFLSTCQGNTEMASKYLKIYDEQHYKLNSEDGRDSAEDLIQVLSRYRPGFRNSYGRTFSFPEIEDLKFSAECGMGCRIGYSPFKDLCNSCYLYWCAEYVSRML